MQGNLFFFGNQPTPRGVKNLLIILVGVALLSPVITYFLHHYFQLPGPQDILPLSLAFLRKGYFFELISYPFIHTLGVGLSISILFSLFIQMLLLWFVATEISLRFGNTILYTLFFSATLLSGLSATALLFLTESVSLLYGSTVPFLSLLGLWMVMMKASEFNFFIFLRVKARTVALCLFALILLINLSRGEFIHFSANLIAILWGILFGTLFLKLDSPYTFSKKKRDSSAEIIDITHLSQDSDEIFMEKMLDKISRLGDKSLTRKEKQRMDDIVKRRKK